MIDFLVTNSCTGALDVKLSTLSTLWPLEASRFGISAEDSRLSVNLSFNVSFSKNEPFHYIDSMEACTP